MKYSTRVKSLVFISLLFAEACSGGGGGSSSPVVSGVLISPRPLAIQKRNTLQFTAKDLSGQMILQSSLTWSVDGTAQNGTIDSNGIYTAPANIPPQGLVTIRAALVSDPAKNDAVSFYILTGPTLSFSPESNVTPIFTLQKINGSLRMAVMNPDVYVIWVTTDQSNVTHLWYSKGDKNGVFSAAHDIIPDIKNFIIGTGVPNPENPAIAVDSLGNVYIVWDDNPSGTHGIYAVKGPNGTTCGATPCFTPFVIINGIPSLQIDPPNPGIDQKTPSVSFNPSGKIDIVWSQTDSASATLIYFKEFNLDGSFAKSSIPVATANLTKQTNPSLAVDLVGDISVAWMDYGGASPNIYYSNMALNQAGFSSLLQVETDSLTQNDSFSLAVDPSGEPYVTWSNSNIKNVTPGVYYATISNNQFQQSLVSNNSLNPTIKVDYLKNIYLTWDDGSSVYFRKINTGPPAPPFNLSPLPGINPVMDIDTSGRVFLMFSSTGTSNFSTFYSEGE
ncbi:MAG: hypothetical protein ACYDBV_03225 [Nitrospiria bacterium]